MDLRLVPGNGIPPLPPYLTHLYYQQEAFENDGLIFGVSFESLFKEWINWCSIIKAMMLMWLWWGAL